MVLGILVEHGREKGVAITTYLQYMIDKYVDYNSKKTRWHYSRGGLVVFLDATTFRSNSLLEN